MSRPNTKQRIQDASERLFARKGYSASIRDISDMAGVNIAAINYYFDTKEKLIQAVLERRLAALNEACVEKLEPLHRAGMKENHTLFLGSALESPSSFNSAGSAGEHRGRGLPCRHHSGSPD